MQGLQKLMQIVISLDFSGMMHISSAIVIGNMVGNENEDVCIC